MKRHRPEEVLEGGWQTTVRRLGDVVHRSPSPWSQSVISLLAHLEDVGFSGSPRPLGSGFDADGNETLTHIPGQSPQPRPWSDEAASKIGSMLAELHKATASFRPPDDPKWKDWYGRHLGDNRTAIGHGDLGPWNIMAIEGDPVGFIDWDTAGPVDPVWELAQTAWLNAQLHDDDIAERVGLGDAHTRARQLKLIVDAYGLAASERDGFVDKMVEFAVRSARNDAIEHDVNPETETGIAEDGYPFVWGITWRVRSASWMLHNRTLLENALRT